MIKKNFKNSSQRIKKFQILQNYLKQLDLTKQKDQINCIHNLDRFVGISLKNNTYHIYLILKLKILRDIQIIEYNQ
ncbi:unnamed protein product [Paramecium sonneborni]|uniref:Uncharacterized protein n=1 Tax=Paramecium sonneborni TaxID=65129 RepID=A0A8S1QE47_9CILI|nr:unnamed protein product [Paramecium sonneborni]